MSKACYYYYHKQGSFFTGVLSRALAALHLVAPPVERLLVAATIDHSAVFEESWKINRVHARKQLEIFGMKATGISVP